MKFIGQVVYIDHSTQKKSQKKSVAVVDESAAWSWVRSFCELVTNAGSTVVESGVIIK